tara:strand:- start:836 stop:1216 length:381 start_codon:yes stop_codon:yes gene_type:complete
MSIDYNKLGTCIDNVYIEKLNYSPSRKVICTLEGNIMKLRYVTIVDIVKEIDKDRQVKEFEREAVSYINERLKNIVDCYKEMCNQSLKYSDIKSNNPASYEIISVSPFSIKRTAKFNYTLCYELKD